MNTVRILVTLVIAVLWAPITWHCKLENIPGLEFLRCASETSERSGCDEDSCRPVESAAYKPSDDQAVHVAPGFGVDFEAVSAPDFARSLTPDNLPDLISAPVSPPPRPAWQVRWRVALPPRAPTVVS